MLPRAMVRGRKNPLYFGFAERLRRARRAAEWSLAELARNAGSTAPTILALESGARSPRVDTAQKLALALGLSPSLLAFGIAPAGKAATKTASDGLAKRLTAARTLRELSMRELEQRADAAGNLVRNTQAGRSLPTLRTIEQLAKALGVSPAWLAYGEGPMEVPTRRRVMQAEQAQANEQ